MATKTQMAIPARHVEGVLRVRLGDPGRPVKVCPEGTVPGGGGSQEG